VLLDQHMQNSDKIKVPSPEIFATFSKEEQDAILALDAMKEFSKGTFLIKEGQTPTQSFFVVKGVVRKFRTNESGEEVTIEFYTEDEPVFSPSGRNKPQASKVSLECIEDCTLSVISFQKEEEMYNRFPRFERMCRETTELNLQAYQEKFANYLSWSPEQRYLDILNNRAHLLDRVPQFQLASYLGVKPESLSRIRSRLATKAKSAKK